jgi:membrane protease YdiL (CAAX protease family)
MYTVIVKGIGVDILVPPELSDSFDRPTGMSRLILAFIVVVMAPVAEETFFRGFVLQGLARRAGPMGAAIGSSVLFSLSHGSVGMLVPTFLSGLILAGVFMKTGSLTPGIFAHSMQNSLAFLLTF